MTDHEAEAERAPGELLLLDSDILFHIQGEHVYFDKLDFRGDAISLEGKGEMDFNTDLHLTFSTRMGRGELGIPVLRDLFTGVSEQLMLIHVRGTLQGAWG